MNPVSSARKSRPEGRETPSCQNGKTGTYVQREQATTNQQEPRGPTHDNATGEKREATSVYVRTSIDICSIGVWGLTTYIVRHAVMFLVVHTHNAIGETRRRRTYTHLAPLKARSILARKRQLTLDTHM